MKAFCNETIAKDAVDWYTVVLTGGICKYILIVINNVVLK